MDPALIKEEKIFCEFTYAPIYLYYFLLNIGRSALQKSAHYRQCEWLQEGSIVLSDVLNTAFENLLGSQQFVDYEIDEGLNCIVTRKVFRRRPNLRLFHFITYERDSAAAVVSIINTDINEVEPPADSEFIESQLFLLIEGDHALYTTHNRTLRDGGVNALLLDFVSQSMNEPHNQFHLVPKFNEDQLRQVFEEGIEYIDLGLGAFAQTIESIATNGRLRTQSALSDAIRFFTENEDDSDARASSEIKSRLVLRPGKAWSKRHVKDCLTGVAMNITQEFDEEFVIVTKAGVRVSHDKITVKEDMEVRGNSRILDVDSLSQEISAALLRLRNSNILEA